MGITGRQVRGHTSLACPATVAGLIDVRPPITLRHTAPANSRSLPARDRRPPPPDVEIDLANAIENRQPTVGKQPHIAAQAARHQVDQRQAGPQVGVGPRHFAGHQAAKVVVIGVAGEIDFAVAVAPALGLRQIDPPALPISGDILAKVGQLQPGAYRIRQPAAPLVMGPRQVEHQSTYGIRRVAAIVEHVVGRLVAMHLLVAAKRHEQIGKGLDRDRELEDGFPQGYEDRMPHDARVAVLQLPFPPIEQVEAALAVVNLVSQVVRPAAIRVHGVKMGPQRTRQQQAGDVKIFVMPLGQVAAIIAPFGQRCRAAKSPAGPYVARSILNDKLAMALRRNTSRGQGKGSARKTVPDRTPAEANRLFGRWGIHYDIGHSTTQSWC